MKRVILNIIAFLPLIWVLYFDVFKPFYFTIAGVKTRGVVIAIETHYPDEASNNTYSPVIEFQTNSGKTIEYRPSGGSIALPYTINDGVAVYYFENNPYDAHVRSYPYVLMFVSIFYIPFLLYWYNKFKSMRKRIAV